MALFQVASRLKLPRSEAGLGGAPQIVPWSLTFDPLLMSFICLTILVVCLCFHRLTCILKVEHVLTLSLHDVLLACRHDLSYDWVHPSFQSLSVMPKRCAYDLMIFYKLSTSMPQWITAAEGCDSIICFHGFVFVISTTLTWRLMMLCMPLNTLRSMGVSLDLCVASVCFLKLLSMPVQLDGDGRSPPNLVVEFDLMEFDWSHLCDQQTFELGTASPPCPPWITASINPLGLKRKDGIVIPAAIALFAMLCCKVICHENVAVCSQHPLWNPTLEWLKLWNFDLCWANCLDLSDVAPRRRERLLVVPINIRACDLKSYILGHASACLLRGVC